MTFATTIRLQKKRVKLPRRWAIGDAVCYNNPTDCCDAGDAFASTTIRVMKRRYIIPKSWLGSYSCEDVPTCCDEAPGTGTEGGAADTGTGTSVSSCCGYDLPDRIKVIEYTPAYTLSYTAVWNGGYWEADRGGGNLVGLRCNAGTWQIGLSCGGGSISWVNATSARCEPFFYAGITGGHPCITDDVSISFLGQGGGESGTGGSYPSYLVRVKKRTIRVPKLSRLSYCTDNPQDCCEEAPADCLPNYACPELSPILARINPTGFSAEYLGSPYPFPNWERLNREWYLFAWPEDTFTNFPEYEKQYSQYRLPNYLWSIISSDSGVSTVMRSTLNLAGIGEGLPLQPTLSVGFWGAGLRAIYKYDGSVCSVGTYTFTFDRIEGNDLSSGIDILYPATIDVEIMRTAQCADSLTCSSSGADRRAFAFNPTRRLSTCITSTLIRSGPQYIVLFPSSGVTCQYEGYWFGPLDTGLGLTISEREAGIRLRYLGGTSWDCFIYQTIPDAIAGGTNWVHHYLGTFSPADVASGIVFKSFSSVTSQGGCLPLIGYLQGFL